LGATGLALNQTPVRAAWKRLAPFVPLGLAAACLWWVVRDIDLSALWQQILNVDAGWLALAVVCDILGYAAQAVRWRLLLEPLGKLRFMPAVRAIYAGLFANEIFPLRPGEVLRAWMAGRELSLSAVAVAPSIFVERLIDGVWLTAGLLVLGHAVVLPSALAGAVHVFTIAVVLVLGAVIVLRPAAARTGAARRWRIVQGLRVFPGSLPLAGAWAASAGMLALQALSFWFTMIACRVGLSLFEAFGVLLVVRIGTLIPGAPANLGTYQFAAVLGAMLFGVPKEVAAPFSMILFASLTFPLWLLGAAAIARSGVDLAGLRRREIEWRGRAA